MMKKKTAEEQHHVATIRHHKIKQEDLRRKYVYLVRFYYPRCLKKFENRLLRHDLNDLLSSYMIK